MKNVGWTWVATRLAVLASVVVLFVAFRANRAHERSASTNGDEQHAARNLVDFEVEEFDPDAVRPSSGMAKPLRITKDAANRIAAEIVTGAVLHGELTGLLSGRYQGFSPQDIEDQNAVSIEFGIGSPLERWMSWSNSRTATTTDIQKAFTALRARAVADIAQNGLTGDDPTATEEAIMLFCILHQRKHPRTTLEECYGNAPELIAKRSGRYWKEYAALQRDAIRCARHVVERNDAAIDVVATYVSRDIAQGKDGFHRPIPGEEDADIVAIATRNISPIPRQRGLPAFCVTGDPASYRTPADTTDPRVSSAPYRTAQERFHDHAQQEAARAIVGESLRPGRFARTQFRVETDSRPDSLWNAAILATVADEEESYMAGLPDRAVDLAGIYANKTDGDYALMFDRSRFCNGLMEEMLGETGLLNDRTQGLVLTLCNPDPQRAGLLPDVAKEYALTKAEIDICVPAILSANALAVETLVADLEHAASALDTLAALPDTTFPVAVRVTPTRFMHAIATKPITLPSGKSIPSWCTTEREFDTIGIDVE